MLELFGGAISAIFGGGATGLLGMVLQRLFDGVFGWLKAKQDLATFQAKAAHEIALREKDAAIMREEWAGRTRVAASESDSRKDVAASEAFGNSLLREPERYSAVQLLTPAQNWVMVILDFLRGIVRPALTVYLCALTTYIWWQVRALIRHEDLSGAEILSLWRLVVETILYLTTTVVLWWFGTRNKQAAPSIPHR